MIDRKYLTDSVSWSMWPGRTLMAPGGGPSCDIHYERNEDKHFAFWKEAMLKRPTICGDCLRVITYHIWLTIRRASECISMSLYTNA